MTTKKEFKKWLFAQPADKQFVYTQGDPSIPDSCLMCCFYKDKGTPQVVGSSFGLPERKWCVDFITHICDDLGDRFSALDAQNLWKKMAL